MELRYQAASGHTDSEEGSVADQLRRLGYRLTPQRLMVLSCLGSSADHMSVEEIHRQVCQRYPRLPISTVYRVLELLEGLHFVTKTDLGEGRVRYHLAEKGHHHHLICERCGKVEEMDEGLLHPLTAALVRQYRFQANLRHLAIFGRCHHCQTPDQWESSGEA
ncbi:MAG: transcriptional repressor [Chloroflexi bacterium]|nr:transcriptional repressor [Chloroflexota bacterium]